MMDLSRCVFCDSEYGDPLMPFHIDKIAFICNITSSKDRLFNKKMCMRCKLDIDLIENAFRLRDIMAGSLNAKLSAVLKPSHHPVLMPELIPSKLPDNPSAPAPPAVDNEMVCTALSALNRQHVKEENIDLPQPPPVTSALPQPPPSAGFGFPLMSNGISPLTVGPADSPLAHNRFKANRRTGLSGRTNRRRIQTCHKCNISLKTRPYPDAIKHIDRCNGKGIRPGRPSLTPKPDKYPCHLCGRQLATREAQEIHLAKCDGTVNNSRGRKPADNTCMLCSEDLVYRHILKKHLRQKHGINAQRLDDSVLAALKTGSATGIGVKEQVINRIQQKMYSDMFNGETDQANGSSEKADSPADTSQAVKILSMNGADSVAEDDDTVENVTPPIEKSVNSSQGSRSRRKVKPSKYVPEIFTCERCNKQFEYQSQYIQHCCFKIVEDGEMEQREGSVDGDVEVTGCEPLPAEQPFAESYTGMQIEESVGSEQLQLSSTI